MALEKELETYQRELATLQGQAGKFVLIQGETIVDLFQTYEDALKEGYQKFGVATPFLVKEIQALDQVQFVTREIDFLCPT